MIPRLISGWPKVADSEARRKSHAIASSHPPPKASELTAAIVTVDDFSIAVIRPWPDSSSSGPSFAGSILVNSLMSAPAENVKMFDEARTTARALPSSSFQTPDSSRISCGESGFAGGRLSHTITTSSRVSTAIVSWAPSWSGCG
jgi:hypothetical protein